MEKYSVLMSLYKEEKPEYFKEAVDSILNQTIVPDEIVIVKDGPLTDELDSIVSQYQQAQPEMFNIVNSENNIGLGMALNLGLKHCKNELVARMDTDDIAKPMRCEKQLMEFASNEQLDLIGSSVDEFFNIPNEIISRRVVPTSHREIYKFSKRRSAFNHPTVMYKKSKVMAVGGYANLRRNQDVDLFGRMLFSGCIASNIEESLLYFRANSDLAKRRKSWENTRSYIKTIKGFWKMGYASIIDYLIVSIAQISMFFMPIKLQYVIYKKFLRK